MLQRKRRLNQACDSRGGVEVSDVLLTEPRPQKPTRLVAARKTCVKEETSIGSPSGVPVPWASMYVTVSGPTPAIACAIAVTCAWPSTLGAV